MSTILLILYLPFSYARDRHTIPQLLLLFSTNSFFYFSRLGPQAEETVNTEQSAMNNQYNQRPGYPYNAMYNYNYPPPPPPYTGVPPYPTTNPYGMPVPVPNYGYYNPIPGQEQTYVVSNSPMYAPSTPYTQTRMASPSPYMGYPPPNMAPPAYNYNTTNLITRPTRPIYPQLNQLPTYPPQSKVTQNQNLNNNNNSNNNVNIQPVVKEQPRDNVESNTSKFSEVSILLFISL